MGGALGTIPPPSRLGGFGEIRKIAVACACLLVGILALFPLNARADVPSDLVSTGSSGGNGVASSNFAGTSSNGTKAWFETAESLVSGDTDTSVDVYERNRTTGTTTLVSTGSAGGNGNFEAFFVGASADGSHVFFETDESLVAADTDNVSDVYDRASGSTTLVSAGGNGPYGASFAGASEDGSRVWFQTDESLSGADTDTTYDVYERSGGNTTLISTGATSQNVPAYFGGASNDGSHVFFQTDEALVATDLDTAMDVYDRSGGATTLVSGGTANLPASFAGASQDGSTVFFETDEALTGSDTDTSRDVYQRSSSTTTLVSDGAANIAATYAGSSTDGSHVFFNTQESLTGSDSDSAGDVYERTGGNTNLVSAGGSANVPATFARASDDGSRVFFETDESLTGSDTDTARDVYERSGGTTKLITGGTSNVPAYFAATSAGGAHVFFETDEALTADDTDSSSLDVYEALGGTITLLSGGANGTFDARYAGESKDGTQVFLESEEPLLNPPDTDTSVDIYGRVDAPYPHPIGASPFRVSMAPVYQPCETPGNSQHGSPLNFPSCHPATSDSSLVAVGPRSIAFARYLVCFSSTQAPPCNSVPSRPDLKLASQISDVRVGSPTGPDYQDSQSTQDLTEVFSLRVTDGASLDGPATVVEQQFSIPMDCTATTDASVGSTCSLNTSANAVVPGVVVSGKAAIWQIGEVFVMDRGQDGVPGNADDRPFEAQGVFVP